MNQQAEDSITQMLNCFPQTSQNYELLYATLDKLLVGLSNQATIEAAERFAAGDVAGQSKKYAPSVPEFVEEVRRRQAYIDARNRPRLPPPTYERGPLVPFEVNRQKAIAENAHLSVLVDVATYDQFRKLSSTNQLPVAQSGLPASALSTARRLSRRQLRSNAPRKLYSPRRASYPDALAISGG